MNGINHPAEPLHALEQRLRCLWCGCDYYRRQNGGKAQRFCAAKCRRAFHSAARIWAEREIAEERLTVEELRVVL